MVTSKFSHNQRKYPIDPFIGSVLLHKNKHIKDAPTIAILANEEIETKTLECHGRDVFKTGQVDTEALYKHMHNIICMEHK
jgi:hypothetical protein